MVPTSQPGITQLQPPRQSNDQESTKPGQEEREEAATSAPPPDQLPVPDGVSEELPRRTRKKSYSEATVESAEAKEDSKSVISTEHLKSQEVEAPPLLRNVQTRVVLHPSEKVDKDPFEKDFDFEDSLGWSVQTNKKKKKGIRKLKGIISELKKEEEKKPEETVVLSFEEAAREVESASLPVAKGIPKSTTNEWQEVDTNKPKTSEDDPDSSPWEIVEISDDSEDELIEVKQEMSKQSEESQRWVEEMNEKNRKKMENLTMEASTSYSGNTFWREPISDLPDLTRDEKKVEAKPAGIHLPTSEMTYDWMDDDAAMGAIDTDDEEEENVAVAKVEQKVEVKAKGIALPTSEMTYDWMDNDTAMGSFDTDDDEDEKPTTRKSNMELDLKTPGAKKIEEVGELFSPVDYWRDPIPEILDPEEPLKNAEKSRKAKKENAKPSTVKKEKNWLANNMAGMFDKKAKTKHINGKVVAPVKTVAGRVDPTKKTEVVKKNQAETKKKNVTLDSQHVPVENTWLDKWKFDDAERKFYEKKEGEKTTEKNSQKENKKADNMNILGQKVKVVSKPRHIVKEITEEIHETTETVYKVPDNMNTHLATAGSKLKEKISAVQEENLKLRQVLGDLTGQIKELTARVTKLEERETSDEGVDLTFPSPSFCPHYKDCTCLSNRFQKGHL